MRVCETCKCCKVRLLCKKIMNQMAPHLAATDTSTFHEIMKRKKPADLDR